MERKNQNPAGNEKGSGFGANSTGLYRSFIYFITTVFVVIAGGIAGVAEADVFEFPDKNLEATWILTSDRTR